jgi:hypothetical protein
LKQIAASPTERTQTTINRNEGAEQWTITRNEGGEEVTRRYTTQECIRIVDEAIHMVLKAGVVHDVQLDDAWHILENRLRKHYPDDFPQDEE